MRPGHYVCLGLTLPLTPSFCRRFPVYVGDHVKVKRLPSQIAVQGQRRHPKTMPTGVVMFVGPRPSPTAETWSVCA